MATNVHTLLLALEKRGEGYREEMAPHSHQKLYLKPLELRITMQEIESRQMLEDGFLCFHAMDDIWGYHGPQKRMEAKSRSRVRVGVKGRNQQATFGVAV